MSKLNPLHLNNPSLAHADILQKVCEPLKSLGVTFFGYTAVDKKGNAFCLGSKPDYAKVYLSRNYAHNDIHYCPNKSDKRYYYDFWDFLKLDKQSEELYQTAAQFDQGHTLTISQHTLEMTHCFHFSGKLADNGINQRFLEKLDSLHLYIMGFRNALNSIPELASVYKLPIQLDSVRHPQTKNPTIIYADPKKYQFNDSLNSTIKFKEISSYCLTEKELECLKWLYLGKSAALIAEIKDVSYKTIERNIDSAKKKLGCYTLFQLGQKVSEMGLVPFFTTF